MVPLSLPDRASDFPGRSAPRAAVELQIDHRVGDHVTLSKQEARHLIGSRRLSAGDAIQAFNAQTGVKAMAVLDNAPEGGGGWVLRISSKPVHADTGSTGTLTIYAAVPKGQRADWMAEKLAEFGVSRWVPILTRRSVVEPGAGKLARWRRLAIEATKQSRAAAAMKIDSPLSLVTALTSAPESSIALTTERSGESYINLAPAAVFIGPEGGWDPTELSAFEAAGVAFATLGGNVLRIETAALAAAAIWSAARTIH